MGQIFLIPKIPKQIGLTAELIKFCTARSQKAPGYCRTLGW